MKDRLIFCRTPLQTLIASQIQELDPANDTVLYQPTTPSAKHHRYFNAMTAVEKVFLNWRPDGRSHFLKEVSTYFSIPSEMKRRKFDEFLVSSFDSLVFSLLTARKDGTVKTFDDGVLNILPSEMRLRLDNEHWAHRWLKRIAGGRNNKQTLIDSVVHFSIFDRKFSYFGKDKTREIALFSASVTAQDHLSPLTVLLGCPVETFPSEITPQILAAYERIVAQFPRDLFIPHPAEQCDADVSSRLNEETDIRAMVTEMIAEDVILHLKKLGHKVRVYGIASTALVNLARHCEVFNIVIPGVNDVEAGLFSSFGVQPIGLAELSY